MKKAGTRPRRLALIAVLIIASSTIAGLPLEAEAAAAPTPYVGKAVPGTHATPKKPLSAPDSSQSITPTATNTAATFTATVQTSASTPTEQVKTRLRSGAAAATVSSAWKAFGGTGISFAQATSIEASTKGTSPAAKPISEVTSVTASVLSSAQARSYGLSGIVLEVTGPASSDSPIAIKVPHKVLDGVYGANYSARVRWVEIPAPATPSASAAKSHSATTIPSADTASTTVLTPQVSAHPMLLAPMSTPVASTGTGSFAATSLKPSSNWDVSAQTGEFSWGYPMRVPPAATGPSPQLALQYDSQSVDGETGSTNNQPSSVGDGWEVSGGGYIERSYVSCSQDNGSGGPVTTSGDLCWKTDNATISVAGHSGQLVKDSSTGVWKLHSDDGSRIEHLVGSAGGCGAANGTYDDDCWRMTTTDGTEYYFGLNELPGWSSGKAVTDSAWTVPVFGNDGGEPCHASTFAASSCTQGWRWNLDYVVDPHGNAEALYYDQELNEYSRDGATATSYVRGGQIDHIDYGLTSTQVYAANAASDRVTFGYDAYGRCSDATHANCTTETLTTAAVAPTHPNYYPDVPFDELCVSGTCASQVTPTFWSDAMLDSITTQYLNAGSYATVDGWALTHSFPDPGDTTSASLWMTSVTHTGYSGGSSISEPPTTFSGTTMQNRVWAVDGLAPLAKYRISSIQSSEGAVTSVNYMEPDCTTSNAAAIEASPQSNTNRCYPQWWTPNTVNPQPAQEDLFNKYVVSSVVNNPETGGPNDATQETDYVYTGTPAWRYDTSPFTPDSQRTWSTFAGYNTVEVRTGSPTTPSTQQTTDYTFYQGLDGDRAAPGGGTKSVSVTGSPGVSDSLWFAGQTREAKTLNGVGGAVTSDTISTPWASPVTSNDGTIGARIVETGETLKTEPLSTGGNRTTDTTSTFDPTYGMPVTTNAATSDAGTTCTTTTYAPPNVSQWMIDFPKEVDSVGVACANLATAVYPAAAMNDTRTSYDGQAWGVSPTVGDATKTQVVDSYSGSTAATAHWITDSTTSYDSMGRVTAANDILGHTTSTAYTPSAGATAGSGPTTQEVTTNTAPFSWTSTTKFNPEWGVETSSTDVNGNLTTANYDALGRRVQVWLPLRPQSSNPGSPSTTYAYSESTTAANSVTTTTIGPATSITSYVLYDGLGQKVQTQSAADAGGGAIITDTAYNSAGEASYTNNPYWTTTSASGILFLPSSESAIASENVMTYDGAGRSTAVTLDSFGAVKYQTATSYIGADRVDTTPPAGGTPTSAYTNSLGEQVKLVQYLAASPLATATKEQTNYSFDVNGNMTGMTDPAGNQWTWGFDVLGHQTSATDPDTGTSTSTYDDAGDKLTSTDARGETITTTYDALRRKTAEYAGSASGSLLDSWAYDTIAKGQLSSSSAYTGSAPGTPGAAFSSSVGAYNAAYQPTAATVSVPSGATAFAGTTYSTAYLYNPDGSIAQQNDPAEGGLAAEKIKYRYSSTGQLFSIAGTSTVLGSASYTSIGQPSQYALTGGVIPNYADFAYDPASGNVKEIENQTFIGSTPTTVSDEQLTYDNAGNITQETTAADSVATDSQCFSYDYLTNLTAAWTPTSANCATSPSVGGLGGPAPYWTNYTVDPATGNRTSETQNPSTSGGTATNTTYAFSPAGSTHPHAVSTVTNTGGSVGVASYGYDADGNTTSRPGQVLTYDAGDRVSTITSGASTQSDVYSASGALLLQSDPTAGSTLYVGDTELHIAQGSSTVTAVRTYSANGAPLAERDTQSGTTGSTLTWLVTDQQGNTTAEINSASGTVTRRYQDPFGNSRGAAPTWSSPHGFLNAPTSSMTSLSQLGARLYDPTLGRFLSVDPVLSPFNPQQNNGYSYAQNSPISLSDPSGLAANVCQMFVGACKSTSPAPGQTSPAAAAPGKSVNVQVSPHVFDSSNDPNLKWMRQQFHAMGGNSHTGEVAEINLWYMICEDGGGGCGQSFLDVLRRTQDSGLGTGMVFAGLGQTFYFITRPDVSGSGNTNVVVRQLSNPDSMVGANEDQLRAMVPKDWSESTDKYGNPKWTPPNGSKGGELRYVRGGAPKVPDPSGVHQGGDYIDVRRGGLTYKAAADGNKAIGNDINGGAMKIRGDSSGDPDFDVPFEDPMIPAP